MLRQIVLILVIAAVIQADGLWRRRFEGKRMDTGMALNERRGKPGPLFADKRAAFASCSTNADCEAPETCDYDFICW